MTPVATLLWSADEALSRPMTQPQDLATGILAKTERPEYGAAYRKAAAAQRANTAARASTDGNKGRA